MKDRSGPTYECDHMRPVVYILGHWHHVSNDGTVSGECQAGTYQVFSTRNGEHIVGFSTQYLHGR